MSHGNSGGGIGIWNILLILLGVILAVAAIGMYTSMNKKGTVAPTPTATPSPTTPGPAATPEPPQLAPITECGIYITSPYSNAPQISPMTIAGFIDGKCHWTAFEGQTGTVTVYNDKNVALSPAIPLMAVGEWMQPSVNFSVKVGYSAPHSTKGYLLFTNEDASGMYPETYNYPIRFQP